MIHINFIAFLFDYITLFETHYSNLVHSFSKHYMLRLNVYVFDYSNCLLWHCSKGVIFSSNHYVFTKISLRQLQLSLTEKQCTVNHMIKLQLIKCCEYLSVQWIWLYVLFISLTRFSVNAHPIVAWISRNSLFDTQSLSDCNRTQTHNHLDGKWKLNHLVKLTKWLSCLVSTYLYGAFIGIFLQSHLTV